MKQSRRARRMQRNHSRHKRTPAFSLVSLMDIFTILVFFLLVNSSDGEVLPSTKSVELPESVAEQKPRQNIVVMVTEQDILVQGKRIARVADLQGNSRQPVDMLKVALETHNKRHVLDRAPGGKAVPEVTIMGGKQIPYRLLKKVMAACTEAGFGKISLAVLQKAAEES
jgi:biopolymer transport protein ExbD